MFRGQDGIYDGLVDPVDIPSRGYNSSRELKFFQKFKNTQLWFGFNLSHCSACDQYDFRYNYGSGLPGLDSTGIFDMNAGESRDFLAGYFIPNGSVELGTYNLFNNVQFLALFQGDIDHLESLTAALNLASACTNGDTSCGFSRTVAVTAVPLPATIWLFISALGLLGFRGHRSS